MFGAAQRLISCRRFAAAFSLRYQPCVDGYDPYPAQEERDLDQFDDGSYQFRSKRTETPLPGLSGSAKARFMLPSILPYTISRRLPYRQRVVCWICSLSLLAFLPAGLSAAGVTVRFAGDSDVGEGGRWARAAAEKWAQKF